MVLDRRQNSHSDHAAGSFAISKFFMSAATRSCPAFLMASDRFDPGGNFFACARASEALAAQSRLSRLLRVSSVMSSALMWRSQLAVVPADGIIGLHRVGVYLRLLNKATPSAPQRPVLESGTGRSNVLNLHARLALGTTRPCRCARR